MFRSYFLAHGQVIFTSQTTIVRAISPRAQHFPLVTANFMATFSTRGTEALSTVAQALSVGLTWFRVAAATASEARRD
jgi:hypothetical protein